MNPWLHVPSQAPYVLPQDRARIDAFNARTSKEALKIHLETMPEPFFGNATAPVVLLGLNPGFDPGDQAVHATQGFQERLRGNYRGENTHYPFYYLDPALECPGSKWWAQKLGPILKKFPPEKLAKSLLCVEFFPYHSSRFAHVGLRLDSQTHGFDLVRSAIARNAVIVIMRSKKLWQERIPELETYAKAFTLNSPQNVTVSPRNCRNFDAIVAALD